MTETTRSRLRVPVLMRPALVLNETPESLAQRVWRGMDKDERYAFQKYVRRLPKITGIDMLGYLELILVLNAAGLVAKDEG